MLGLYKVCCIIKVVILLIDSGGSLKIIENGNLEKFVFNYFVLVLGVICYFFG